MVISNSVRTIRTGYGRPTYSFLMTETAQRITSALWLVPFGHSSQPVPTGQVHKAERRYAPAARSPENAQKSHSCYGLPVFSFWYWIRMKNRLASLRTVVLVAL